MLLEVDDGEPEELTGRRRGGRPHLGWLVLAAALVSAATTVLLDWATTPRAVAALTTVPAVVSLSEPEARVVAESAKLTLEVAERLHDALVPPGAVAWQRPLAGSRVPIGSPLQVRLSLGLPGR